MASSLRPGVRLPDYTTVLDGRPLCAATSLRCSMVAFQAGGTALHAVARAHVWPSAPGGPGSSAHRKSVREAELETNEVCFCLEAQASHTATAVDVTVNAIVDHGACCGPSQRLVMTAADATACCGRVPQASLRIHASAADRNKGDSVDVV